MKPICVDLDNTLIFADTMFLLWLQVLKKNPILAFYAIFIFLFTGSAQAKHFLTCHGHLDIENLPYNQPLIIWLRKQKEKGHPIWLVTGCNQFIANRIALYLSFFDGVLASDKQNNLVSQKKAMALKNHFASFIYIGDHKQDLAVWDIADESGIVCHNKKPPFDRTFKYVFDRPQASLQTWSKLLRLDHWPKNLLLWIPILLGYPVINNNNILLACITTLSLCLFASVGYVINDALDLKEDLTSKRHQGRPFVTGSIGLPKALQASLGILLVSCGLLFWLPFETSSLLLLYFCMSLAYSLVAKRLVILDVFILASLYGLRIEIGCSLVHSVCSPELSLSILFICLGLACAKRFSDLTYNHSLSENSTYTHSDISLISTIGIGTSCIGVMLASDFVRHLITSTNHFTKPNYLFLSIPLVLYWQFKIWYGAHHNNGLNEPVVFLKSQTETYILSLLFFFILYFAI